MRGLRTTLAATSSGHLGVAAGLAAVGAWGFGAVISKHIDLSGVALAFHRMWISALLYVAILRSRGVRMDLVVLRRAAPAGLAFAANIACFFTAVKLTTIANATIIGALQPVLTLGLAGRFGERPDRAVITGTGLGLAGVVLVVIGSSGTPQWSLRGDLFAVGAVVAFTAYFAVAKRARDHLGALELQWGAQVVAALVLAPLVALSGQSFALPSGTDAAWLALLIAVPGTGHLLMNWAHAHVPLTITSMLTLAVPVVSSAAAAVFLGEAVGVLQVVGAVVVLGALGAVVAHASRPAAPIVTPPDLPHP
ncbi:MAG TPA: DMT family transporter [Acidimicrobiales bacterium]|nr:DMT family transporter [Acidimicrobiales bacterium]